MAITKSRFVNYIRCPRYAALDDIRNKLLDDVSLEEYKEKYYTILEQNIELAERIQRQTSF